LLPVFRLAEEEIVQQRHAFPRYVSPAEPGG
jgi:hypothetical protein